MKNEAQLFYADVMAGPNAPHQKEGHTGLARPDEVKYWLECAGLKYYSQIDITSDVQMTLLRGLHNSLNMVANIRKLHDPWRKQRFKAFQKELEDAVMLHLAFQRGERVAMGFYFTKKS